MNTHSSQTTHTQMNATTHNPRPQQFKEYTDKYGLLGIQRCDMVLVNGEKNTVYGVKSGKKMSGIHPVGHHKFRFGDDLSKYNKRGGNTFVIYTGNRGDPEKDTTWIDFDTKESYAAFEEKCPIVKDRLRHITNKGFHVCYRYNPELKQTQDKDAAIDCRNDGGLIFAYPTFYYDLDGNRYEYKKSDGIISEMTDLEKTWFKDNNVKIFKNAPHTNSEKTKTKTTTKKKAVKKEPESDSDISDDETSTETSSVQVKNTKPPLAIRNKAFREMEYYYENGLFDNIFKQKNKNAYFEWGMMGCVFKSEFGEDGKKFMYRLNTEKYSELHTEEGFESNWNSWRHYPKISLGSIKFWLKRENPVQYPELQREWYFTNGDLENQGFTTGLLTDYFEELYPSKFLCQDKKVYFFNGVYWEEENKNMSNLTKFVDKDFFRKLLEYQSHKQNQINKEYIDAMDSDEFKRLTKKLNKFLINCSKVRCSSWRSGLIKDILTRVTNDNVIFDTNDYHYVFNNCVIDLKTNTKITPDPLHYNSLCCGYDYKPADPERKEELERLINNTHKNEVIRNWWYIVMSSGLCGKQLQRMFFFQGTGGNGKSIFSGLMLKTTGGYGIKMPTTFFMQPCEMKPLPEIANCHNKRFCLSQEPSNKKAINESVLKEWTGDTKFNVRTIYSDKTCITLKGTNAMECNDMPNIGSVDDGVNRRIAFVKYNAKAVDKEKYDQMSEDFIKEHNIVIANSYYTETEFQDGYKMEFFHLLMEHGFKRFVENNFEIKGEPNSSKCDRDSYLKKNDVLFSWFDRHYVQINEQDKQELSNAADYQKNGQMGDKEFERVKQKYIQTISTIHKTFTRSEDFQRALTKEQRKDYKNLCDFKQKLKTNIFLQYYIKDDTTYCKCKVNSASILGYKETPYDPNGTGYEGNEDKPNNG